eukprot:CAMPEP_0172646018 /NCGR_PEP_ID=MMETSP1068-20121228/240025_1 /TAXON_ID=35684 /ORGANISM="Pseudopedinella elastica, Strain CCMP716" /LENGTH=270 /DNA_ID=CAMNT_0013460267 /DNA_START=50 /DNA_END=862 /DNA_ORIENTATION=-
MARSFALVTSFMIFWGAHSQSPTYNFLVDSCFSDCNQQTTETGGTDFCKVDNLDSCMADCTPETQEEYCAYAGEFNCGLQPDAENYCNSMGYGSYFGSSNDDYGDDSSSAASCSSHQDCEAISSFRIDENKGMMPFLRFVLSLFFVRVYSQLSPTPSPASCSSHQDCEAISSTDIFCYNGGCSSCEAAYYCSGGIDGTVGCCDSSVYPLYGDGPGSCSSQHCSSQASSAAPYKGNLLAGVTFSVLLTAEALASYWIYEQYFKPENATEMK